MYFRAVIIEDDRLSSIDILVWYTLCSFATWKYSRGQPVIGINSFPSYEAIAARSKLSRRSVAYSIKKLKELGYIEVTSGQDIGRSNHYILHPTPKDVNNNNNIKEPEIKNIKAQDKKEPENKKTALLKPQQSSQNKKAFENRPSVAQNYSTEKIFDKAKTKDDYITIGEHLDEQREKFKKEMSDPKNRISLLARMKRYNAKENCDDCKIFENCSDCVSCKKCFYYLEIKHEYEAKAEA